MACLALVLVGAAAAAPSARAAASPVVVSLTFDDGDASQLPAATMLAAHGMNGTFFINSGTVGTAGHATWGQLYGLAADGHEIAGHTFDHANLPPLTAQQIQWEVCEDRARLLKHGFAVTDFAYPYGAGAGNSTVRTTLQQCGYNSARRSWGLVGPDCTSCTDYAETIPPRDTYAVATADPPKSITSLETIEGYVTNAQNHGGGWVVLVFHEICDGCTQYSTSQATLQGLLDWLQQQATNGTVVKTVSQVIGGTVMASPGTADAVAPTSSISCNSAACSTSGYTSPVQVALAGTDTGGSGLEAIRYTTDGSNPTLASAVYTGPFTVSTTTTVKYSAWDNAGNVEATNSQPIQFDTTPPTSTIACNNAVCSSSTYTAPVSVSLSASDPDDAVAAIRYTTDGSDPTTSSTLYTGAFTISTTTTVKYRAWDTAGNVEATKSQLIQVDTFAPTVSITTPANGSTLTGNIKIVAAPADAQTGVASVAFYVDGVLVGTTTSSPWQLPWNTKKASSGQHVLTAVATDRAGNRVTSAPVTVTVK